MFPKIEIGVMHASSYFVNNILIFIDYQTLNDIENGVHEFVCI